MLSFSRYACILGRSVLGVLAALALVAAAEPPEPTEAELRAAAVSLTGRAVAHFRAVGRQRALAEFSDRSGAFVAGEAYVFCHAADGTVIAHGGNPALVGRNMMNARDPDGRRPTENLNRIALTEGAGWFEFRWPNPVTKRIQDRVAYILKVDDDTVCGSGYVRR
jgi:signal transduction histidine kinase